jgi:glycerol-3-phosphate cytidylyltransferase-like family protein
VIAGRVVVYTSGTFDMLHVNHLRMLEYAVSCSNRHQQYICSREDVIYYLDL